MVQPRHLILVTIFVALLLPSCGSQEVLPRAAMAPEDFELLLSAEKEVYRVGEIPKFKATLINKSGIDIAIVLPTDGSSLGFRYPLLTYKVTVPDDAVGPERFGYCGNTNPIHPNQFKTLRNLEEIQLHNQFGGMGPPELGRGLRGPGDYTFQLTYSTDEQNIAAWLGGPFAPEHQEQLRETIEPLLAEVPRIILKSDILQIRYEERFESLGDAIRHGSDHALYAIRRMNTRPVTLDEREALVDQLVDYLSAPPEFDQEMFFYHAFPLLADIATAQDAERIWETVEPIFGENGRVRAASHIDWKIDLLRILMALSPPDRQDVLTYVFTEHTYENGTGTPISPFRRNLQPLLEDKSEDITLTLRHIHDTANLSSMARTAVAAELAKRGAQ